MAVSQTLMIIKPDAVAGELTGTILARISTAGFRITAIKMLRLSESRARKFYLVHKDKPFYDSLVKFMVSGPVVVAILEKENAVEDFRKLIGATDPEKAEEGTIRKLYAESLERNAVHGSDSPDNARIECDFFFSQIERF